MFYSISVFDTILTYRTVNRSGVFACMQHTLRTLKEWEDIDSFIADNFFELRIGSERQASRAFASGRHSEVSLEKIYEVLEGTGNLTPEQIRRLMDLEKKTETQLLIPVPDMVDRLNKLLQEHHQVVLISDTYWDEDTIRDFLKNAGCSFYGLPIYSSGSYGRSKAEGGLYEVVCEKEKASYSEWNHIGPDIKADLDNPEKYGIRAERVQKRCLLPLEIRALEKLEDRKDAQLMIGASVNARFFHKDELQMPYVCGTSLCGVIAVSYISWVLDTAEKKGIKRLYFIARDGYALQKTADRIINEKGLDIKTGYIYGSRKAWRLAGLTIENWTFDRFLMGSFDDSFIRVGEIASLLEMTEEEFVSVLPKNKYRADDLLNRKILEEIKTFLLTDAGFREIIIQEQKEKRATAVRYLQHALDTSDEHFAFVELVGSGYTQTSLQSLMSDFTPFPVKTFFCHRTQNFKMENCDFYDYLPADFPGVKMMEILFTAPHGKTIGYRYGKNDLLEPVLNNEHLPLMEYGLESMIRGLEDYLEQYCMDYRDRPVPHTSLVLFYMKYMTEPDRELLAFLGDMPFGFTGQGKDVVPYAPDLSAEELEKIYSIRGFEPYERFFRGTNLGLSLKRLSPEQRRRKEEYIENRSSEQTAKKRKQYWLQHGGYSAFRILFVYPLSPEDRRIALYGAGKNGKLIYRIIEEDEKMEVVVWVDRDYKRYRKESFSVEPVEALFKTDYDRILISIADRISAAMVKETLIREGILPDKIVMMGV